MKRGFVIICARSGSKGIKNKNLKKIGKLSLVERSIKIAKKLKNIKKIIVSTDSIKIANKAKKLGVLVPGLRPRYLSKDKTPEINVWKYIIKLLRENKNYKFDIKKDYLVSLSPTSPLRSLEDVKNGIKNFLKNNKNDALVSINESHRNPYFNMVVKSKNHVSMICKSKKRIFRRQDCPTVYDMNTVVYVLKPDFIVKAKHLFEGKVSSVIIPKNRSIDIDDEIDLKFARVMNEKR